MAFDMSELSANLRAARARTRCSQSEVAKIVGVSRAALRAWEAGENTPGIDSVYELACFYGISIDALTGWKLDDRPTA